jgi:thiol-disulfide isomerase/thioredoxin
VAEVANPPHVTSVAVHSHRSCTVEIVTTTSEPLPNGVVVVVKRECETCQMVVPVLGQLASSVELTVYTQDDPAFPVEPRAHHDIDLAVSWHHEIETVPTVIRVVDGVEVERTVGWHRPEWERVTGVAELGEGLPPMRPGCGSMSVDPDLVDALRVRFGASVLASRRIDVADAEDEFEMMFNRGWTVCPSCPRQRSE